MLKRVVTAGLRLMGRELISLEALELLRSRTTELAESKALLREYAFIRSLPWEAGAQALRFLPLSRSQFRQDLFVLSETGFKRSGYFVEFGATNGVDISNSWLMEKHFGWSGILAEPARVWHEDLRRNRSCIVDERCVWTESGKDIEFSEVASPELSTISNFAFGDMHSKNRTEQQTYKVRTVSLVDLLRENDAPHEIDYLSIDTEGSELEILKSFDFTSYRIRIITVEHNYTPAREKIRELLTANGYQQRMMHVSSVDDWYVLP